MKVHTKDINRGQFICPCCGKKITDGFIHYAHYAITCFDCRYDLQVRMNNYDARIKSFIDQCYLANFTDTETLAGKEAQKHVSSIVGKIFAFNITPLMFDLVMWHKLYGNINENSIRFALHNYGTYCAILAGRK